MTKYVTESKLSLNYLITILLLFSFNDLINSTYIRHSSSSRHLNAKSNTIEDNSICLSWRQDCSSSSNNCCMELFCSLNPVTQNKECSYASAFSYDNHVAEQKITGSSADSGHKETMSNAASTKLDAKEPLSLHVPESNMCLAWRQDCASSPDSCCKGLSCAANPVVNGAKYCSNNVEEQNITGSSDDGGHKETMSNVAATKIDAKELISLHVPESNMCLAWRQDCSSSPASCCKGLSCAANPVVNGAKYCSDKSAWTKSIFDYFT